ncbi:succinate dehydrogenase, cytochrome b556 subunit [Piscirickettsia litoralis]|uniref:Succinate dehydrogenase cytochrome b556 subunit n=1 Tax=Piscirickettsia litoralis TaxID=1891921 RepID=A0ABX3A1J2_9GAMM|nr:succinate dehydrogenase, cytochrome b556 subunit [Piscirickettsia litoralis]ODN42688.1 succinate dehydrogenase, cytochrome b556 subunit [Piscirickettsia litoralis]
MSDKRPVNLDITTIRMPITAISSILHRISGILVFILMALLLWGLEQSLSSEAGFRSVVQVFASGWMKFGVWVFLSALLYHLVAGVRHLLMDIGIGETKQGGRAGAVLVLVVSIVLIIALGYWLW